MPDVFAAICRTKGVVENIARSVNENDRCPSPPSLWGVSGMIGGGRDKGQFVYRFIYFIIIIITIKAANTAVCVIRGGGGRSVHAPVTLVFGSHPSPGGCRRGSDTHTHTLGPYSLRENCVAVRAATRNDRMRPKRKKRGRLGGGREERGKKSRKKV